jgi:SAM-dependent methyltransferase
MNRPQYLNIVSHYEKCLREHGDTHRGVDWPKAEDAAVRYRVMLDVIRPSPPGESVRLLDFGCGAAHLYEYIQTHELKGIDYSGLDLSGKFVELSQQKFPSRRFYLGDILENAEIIPQFDYIVMNGVFTEKRDLSFEQMFDYFKQLVLATWKKVDRGLALNVMSKQVDWEREDLFHLSFDTLAKFLTSEVTRNFIIRNDYGLYEYTTYIYR